jgi:hypothetical protein
MAMETTPRATQSVPAAVVHIEKIPMFAFFAIVFDSAHSWCVPFLQLAVHDAFADANKFLLRFGVVSVNDEPLYLHARLFVLYDVKLSDGGVDQVVPHIAVVDGVVLLGVKHGVSFLPVCPVGQACC